MSTVDGQEVKAQTFNTAYVSKTQNSTVISVIELNKTGVGYTQIPDTQKLVNKIQSSLGVASDSDINADNYSSNTYVTDGDDRKVAIGKLDAALTLSDIEIAGHETRLDTAEALLITHTSQIADHETRIDVLEATVHDPLTVGAVGSTPNANGLTLTGQLLNLEPASSTQPGVITSGTQTLGGNKTFNNDVVVVGNFEVQGTTTSVNSTNLEVLDQSITVNNGGTNGSAETAGIVVERPLGNAAIEFDSTLPSFFKLGLAASLREVVVSGVAQIIGGLKTFTGGIATDTIDENTVAAGVTIDGVLLKDGLTDGRDVSVDGTALDSHIANTSNPHSTTKAQVGLTNVTDDAQLKRAAGDLNTFTEKLTLAPDDIFIMEDSADSFNKKKIKGSNVGAGGSGGGAINLIAQGNAEISVTSIFVPYEDAISARPVDGTGGSPLVTTSVSSVNPLAGTKSFILSKPPLNILGNGWAVPFTVPPAYRAKSLKISVSYIVASGTFTAGTRTTDGDVIWYIYDVTNSLLIEPSNIKMFSNSSGVSDVFEATFQTSSNGASYRLIAHVATTSMNTFDLRVDEVTVSPQTYVYGSPNTDWQSFTPTGTWTTNTTYTGRYRRDGDTMIMNAYVQTSGAPNAAILSINLPTGFVIDTAKRTAIISAISNLPCTGKTWNGAANVTNLTAVYSSTTAFTVAYENTGTGQLAAVTQAVPFAYGAGMFVEVEVSFPILGWSSSVQISDSADTRISLAVYSVAATAAITNGVEATIPLSTMIVDTHAAVIGDQYRVQSSGPHRITITGGCDVSTNTGYMYVVPRRNGTNFSTPVQLQSSTSAATYASAIFYVDCFSGDLLEARCAYVQGANRLTSFTVSFEKIQGPQAIAQSETIRARYSSATGQSIPSGVATILNFATLTRDTHGAVTTGAGWSFTAPVEGAYSVSVKTTMDGAAWTAGQGIRIQIFRGGVFYSTLDHTYVHSTVTVVTETNGSDIVELLAGQTMDVRMFHDRGGAITLVADDSINFINILKVK